MITLTEQHPLIKTWQEAQTFHIDVRQLLESGGEPYTYIMECLVQLDPGRTLAVHALFEPKPLIRQVHRAGFLAASRHEAPEHWILEITCSTDPEKLADRRLDREID